MGDSPIILTDKEGGQCIRALFPLRSVSDNVFRDFFFKKSTSILSVLSFLQMYYSPICDSCEMITGKVWYASTTSNSMRLVICKTCFESDNFCKDMSRKDFANQQMPALLCPNAHGPWTKRGPFMRNDVKSSLYKLLEKIEFQESKVLK